MGQLDGMVAIVTGGARGIGAGIASVMASQGAKVAILDLDGETAAKTASELAVPGVGMACDVILEQPLEAAVKQIVDQLGGLDIFVNNAGAGRMPLDPSITPAAGGSRVENMASDVWDEQLAQNLRSTFLGTKVAVPYLKSRGGGSIVNIASIAGLSASPTLPAYAAAKAGVISLSRSTALEYAPANIRVNRRRTRIPTCCSWPRPSRGPRGCSGWPNSATRSRTPTSPGGRPSGS